MQWNVLNGVKENLTIRHFKKIIKSNDFMLPFREWDKVQYVLPTIFFASFVINLLSLAFPLFILQVYDRIIPNDAMNTLLLLAIGVVIALLIEMFLKIIRSYVTDWADAKSEHKTSCRAFFQLVKTTLASFEEAGAGTHLKRLNALNQLRDFYSGQAFIALVDMPFILILLALIAYIANWLVFIPAVMLILLISSTMLQTKNLYHVLHSRHHHDDRRFNFIIETLSNIHTVKSCTMEAQMMRRYERLQRSSSVHDYDVILKGSDSLALGISMSQLTLILVVAVGSLLVIHGNLTIGGLAACTLLSGRVLQPANNMVKVWVRLKSIQIAKNEIKKLFAMPVEINESLPDIGEVQGNITFSNVSFKYKNENSLFENLNLTVKAKETIAIEGEGLTGKSTLFWLLMGIIKPDEGEIFVDDKNIHDINLATLRRQIAYLPQDGVLFNGTVMENLTMFDNGKYREKAKEISIELGLDKIIEHFPEGYETRVAHHAIDTLPRGIIQRITIARALLHKPPIILFDEANQSLDMQGDALLRELLSKLSKQSTLIIVSHRPSFLNLAKRRYRLTNGNLQLQS